MMPCIFDRIVIFIKGNSTPKCAFLVQKCLGMVLYQLKRRSLYIENYLIMSSWLKYVYARCFVNLDNNMYHSLSKYVVHAPKNNDLKSYACSFSSLLCVSTSYYRLLITWKRTFSSITKKIQKPSIQYTINLATHSQQIKLLTL